MQEIKYRYALDEHGILIDVLALNESDRKDFECIACRNVLRPVLGKKRRKHFRHHEIVSCSGESYLHRLAKLVFRKSYEQCLENNKPFNLELQRHLVCNSCGLIGPCDVGNEYFNYDLTGHFRRITEETKDNNKFIPDLLLLGPNLKKIYIEMAVSHLSSSDKIESNIPIVEYEINSEEDVEEIKSCRISEINGMVALYNFNVEPRVLKYNKKCDKKITRFVLYKSGKSFIGEVSPLKIDNLWQNNVVSAVKDVNSIDHKVYIDELEKAHIDGYVVKNCYLCRYHSGANNHYRFGDGPDKKGPIFCKFLKERVSSNDAADCEYYRIDEKVFGTERYEDRSWYKRKR